jgi:hypothetical protein
VKIDFALRELHRAESTLARDLLALAERHRAEHEVHHVARDLAEWSRRHVEELVAAGGDHGLRLDPDPPVRPGPLVATLREPGGRRTDPGLVLLADLRRLHRVTAGVSLDWELLAQGAQAVKDGELLELAGRCHPQTLRQLKWTNAMLKTLSPQILAS